MSKKFKKLKNFCQKLANLPHAATHIHKTPFLSTVRSKLLINNVTYHYTNKNNYILWNQIYTNVHWNAPAVQSTSGIFHWYALNSTAKFPLHFLTKIYINIFLFYMHFCKINSLPFCQCKFLLTRKERNYFPKLHNINKADGILTTNIHTVAFYPVPCWPYALSIILHRRHV